MALDEHHHRVGQATAIERVSTKAREPGQKRAQG
jgi:hypothetical protein